MDRISDWLKYDGTILSFQEIVSQGVKITWQQYCQIISAIPKQWKIAVRNAANQNNRVPPIISAPNELELLGMTPRQQIKSKLIKDKLEQSIGVGVWNRYLNENKTKKFWQEKFLLARKMVAEVRLQVFQYKILHQVVATQQYLYRRKRAISEKCRFCNNTETVPHMFYECQIAKKIMDGSHQ